MNGRMSLVEQKRLQWAKEREEMAKLSWGPNCGQPADGVVSGAVRTRMSSLAEVPAKKQDARSELGTSRSFSKVAGESKFLRASLISLHDAVGTDDHGRNAPVFRRRSPSLPPIYTRETASSLQQLFEVERAGSRYQDPDHTRRLNHRNDYLPQNHLRAGSFRRGSSREDLEGETSGYASDSADVPLPAVVDSNQNSRAPGTAMSENGLLHVKDYNYRYTTPESSLPPSPGLSAHRPCADVRPRWGSLWGQEPVRGDPPPPSWLERGLSRMDHTSQVLVINHESASSPDSSTTGSAGSDSNKTYLRGQNVPLDEGILQEREAKRQKALELQNAIKHQLQERDRQRKAEKQQRLKEEQAEEERIKRERDEEKQRFEEEQRRLKEREDAKHKQAEAMRQVLEAAERLAKEEKKLRRKRNDVPQIDDDENYIGVDFKKQSEQQNKVYDTTSRKHVDPHTSVEENIKRREINHLLEDDSQSNKENVTNEFNDPERKFNTIQLPVSTEIAIVLSGRLQDPEIFNNASNLQVNLVVTPSPNKSKSVSNSFNVDDAVFPNSSTAVVVPDDLQSRYSETIDTRLLTPSKYRTLIGREFGTQTDLEDMRNNAYSYKSVSTKDRKESLNATRRDIEKSTNASVPEDQSTKPLSRSKATSRSSLEARPRWNANRPGTRYRTQSEKDPHYQRRLRLRRRQVDSSDEGSRSPSPERRKPNNLKCKGRNASRRKIKLDSYDADLSMDSLNSIVPLRIDKNGRINIENSKNDTKSKTLLSETSVEKNLLIKEGCENVDTWCGRDILSKLTNLRNKLFYIIAMAFQLDDLLRDDKKDANLIPDLSKATCNSQEEFRRLLERCPEYKIKSEKVKKEDSKVRDRDFSWRATKRELRANEKEYGYGDPVPPDMRGLNLGELQQVSIDWRMLTPIRPKLKQDEELFSRLVHMGKLEIKTAAKERHNSSSPVRRSKNRAGIIESSAKMCGDCGEEFCFGEACGDILYDSCIRVTVAPQQSKIRVSADTAAIIAKMDKPKKKLKKKSKFVRSKLKKHKNQRTSNGEEAKILDDVKEEKKFKRQCKKKCKINQ